MKLQQSGSTITVSQSGDGQLISGIISMIIGFGGGAVALSGVIKTSSGKSSPGIALVAFLIGIFGVFVFLFAKKMQTTIEAGGTTNVFSKRIIGGKQHTNTFPTSDITAVRLITELQQNGSTTNRSSQRQSTLSLLLKDNTQVLLGNKSGGGMSVNGINTNSFSKAPLSNEANQLSTFLNVPLQGDDTSTLAGAIKTVKDVFLNGQANVPTVSSAPQSTPNFTSPVQEQNPTSNQTIPPTPPQA